MVFFGHHGVLGINARNLLFIRPYNKKKAIRMADSKLKTKHFLSTRGIPVPRLYGTIRTVQDLEKFDFSALPLQFVLKPNSGAGGEGIVLVWHRQDGRYILPSGASLAQSEFEEHIRDILDGRFSISGIVDEAFFEQLLTCDQRLAKFAYKGLPDVRVVVHNLVPVMAMLRLPTTRSGGKANLHQGAVGVGIDIAKGEATHIVQGARILEEVPGAGPIRGFKIPYWDDILMIASRIQMETNLGYLAVDIALDEHMGPVLLEMNARAGLGVQIANLAPLRRRLERVAGIKISSCDKGVRVAKDLFGHVAERDIKVRTGKTVVGISEFVTLLVGAKPYRLKALINPHVQKTQLHDELKSEFRISDDKVKFILGGRRVQTIVSYADFSEKDYRMVVGRRDLRGFLVDTSLAASEDVSSGPERLPDVVSVPSVSSAVRRHYKQVDEMLYDADRRIKLLYHLKPLNLESEQRRFLTGEVKNPVFVYPAVQFDPYKLREMLEAFVLDDSPLGTLFERKRWEILAKMDLVTHRGVPSFFDKSVALYGGMDAFLVEEARALWSTRPDHFKDAGRDYTALEALHRMERFFRKVGLAHWRVKLRSDLVADCTAGKENTFFIREGAMFTETRLRMVRAHEIETHVFTAENGKLQPYKIFQRGTGDYLTTQEGLAIYNQERAVTGVTEKHFWNVALVLLIDVAMNGSFREVFEVALSMGFSEEKSFQLALKSKRGFESTVTFGAFTKDLIYFRGKRLIEDFVASGGDLRRLYLGKIDLGSLELVEAIPSLVSPRFLPSSLLKSAL